MESSDDRPASESALVHLESRHGLPSNSPEPKVLELSCRFDLFVVWLHPTHHSAHPKWLSRGPKSGSLHLDDCSFLFGLFSRLSVPDGASIYTDLPHRQCSDNPPATIPLNLSVSSARSNMVKRINERKLHILYLTVCSNTPHGFKEARTRKLHKPLITDLETMYFPLSYLGCKLSSWILFSNCLPRHPAAR